MLRQGVILLAIGAMVCAALGQTSGQAEIQPGKVYRVLLANNKEVVGEVTDVGEAYKVKVGTGITQTVPKSRVLKLIPVEERPDAAGGAARRGAMSITQAEIEEILGSESVEDLYVWDYVEPIDLMEELELDREALDEMLRIAGKSARYIETPHFVCVYTSEPPKARELVARLERVYEWNVQFTRMFQIPPRRPERKLEIFYFATHDEFVAYHTLMGMILPTGVLGMYMRTNNRCAFFDMDTWPPVARALELSRDKNVPPDQRLRYKNEYERWANLMNLEVIQHETTHLIHFNIGVFPKEGDMGKWLTEGLCVQFEVPPGQAGGSFGAINYGRLHEWRQLYGPNGEAVTWQFIRDLILSPGGGGHEYVMGWALNYYLRKQFKEQYGKFMRQIAALEDDWTVTQNPTDKLAQFEECFGKLDEEWVKKFCEFIAAIPMRMDLVPEFPAEAAARPTQPQGGRGRRGP